MEGFQADFVKIAAGDVSNIPHDVLAVEAIMQRILLSSQASEGVHRQTGLVKVRAPAPALLWISASALVHQNIECVRFRVENENGEQVDGRLRLGIPFEALGSGRLVLGEIGLFCFSHDQQRDRCHR